MKVHAKIEVCMCVLGVSECRAMDFLHRLCVRNNILITQKKMVSEFLLHNNMYMNKFAHFIFEYQMYI